MKFSILNFPSIIFILYLFVGFVPYFGTIDIIGPQWFYLSILNFISLLYLLQKKIFYFNKSILFSIIALFAFSSLSILKAINLSESLIELSRLFIFLSSIFVLLNLSKEISNFSNWVINIVLLALIAELLFFYINLYFSLDLNPDKRGLAGNMNISAMSIVVKFSIVLSFFFAKKANYISLSILSFFSFLAIAIIGSRTSLIACIVILISLILYYFIYRSYYLKLYLAVILSFVLALFTSYKLSDLFNSNKSIASFTISDTSANERLLYYKEALFSFFENPLLGVGIGNWKLISIKLHSAFINQYYIPYHVHNDFLQFLAEIGIFGFLAFISLFILLLFYAFKIFRNKKISNYIFFISLSLVCYLVDSLFNFPMARPLSFTILLIIIVFILYNTSLNNFVFYNRGWVLILLFTSLICVYSSYTVFDSFKKQTLLLNDYRLQTFNTSLSVVNSISSVYPNITATGLPIDALKANYYKDNIDTTFVLLNKASKANPYIMYPEFLKSLQYSKLNKLDSSYLLAKKAFYALPNNEFHAINYLNNLAIKNDSLEMDRVYEITAPMKSKAIIYNYLKERSLTTFKSNDPKFLNIIDIHQDIIEKDRLEPLKLIYKYGLETVKNINIISSKGEESFDSKKYLEAADYFLKAYKTIPDPSYLENAAHSYYLANYNNNAETILSNLISNKLSKSGKAHYLYGLLQFEISNKNRGCDFLTESLKMGYKDSALAIKQLCN